MPKTNLNDQQSKDSKNKKTDLQIGVSLILALAVVALIFVSVIIPMVNDSRALKAELTNNKLLLTQLQDKSELLDLAQVNYEKIGTQAALLDEAMGDYSDVPQAAAIVEKLTTEILEEGGPLVLEGISVEPMSNDNLQSNSPAVKHEAENTLNISFIGDYQAVRDFILKLKTLRHNFTVNQINITAPQDNNLNQFLTVNVNLKYYYFQ
ncbi:MAG: hypothetical protein Q4G02_01565 [bacterium]|nr:hypothetical protein [bacterium]